MSPIALLTSNTPPTLRAFPIWIITPYSCTILWYSSILVGVYSLVNSSIWLFLIKIAEESPRLAIMSLLLRMREVRQVVPSGYSFFWAISKNSSFSSWYTIAENVTHKFKNLICYLLWWLGMHFWKVDEIVKQICGWVLTCSTQQPYHLGVHRRLRIRRCGNCLQSHLEPETTVIIRIWNGVW